MRSLSVILLVSAAFVCGQPVSAQKKVTRPKIFGVSHVAYNVSDLAKARTFYESLLGFAEPSALQRDAGTVPIAFIKINDNQYIELCAEPAASDGQLNHIAFYTDDAKRMREYLAGEGVKVPDAVVKGPAGDLQFTVTDPDGHKVEIVEYAPDSWTAQHHGKDMPATRVSRRIMHTGFTVGSLKAAQHFYSDILGFHEFWRGSSNGTELSWVNVRVPDGEDYVEFMLFADTPSAERRGTANHVCLEVQDVTETAGDLRTRASATGYTRPIEVRVGKNRKRQANLFDPDGTRVELMEPSTIDGRAAPPSGAPPPRP